MARKRTKAAKEAQALLVWLETLDLPTRVINALRRDLEVVTGEREGEDGGGALAGFDQARFAEELYRPRGGQIGKVPSVAASAIEALRAAIPAPASNGDSDALEPAKDDEVTAAPADVAPGGAEAGPSPQDDREAAAPANATLEGAEATPDAEQEEAEAVLATDGALEAAPEEPSADAAQEAAADDATQEAAAAQEAAAEPGEAPVAPTKRRGRPPRAALETADSPTPARRPGRRPRGENAPAIPAAGDTAAHLASPRSAPPAEAATAALAAPTASLVADPSFGVMLRLWRELHPQGQRAAMRFMAALVGEG